MRRVLIIDDEPSLLVLLEQKFAREGLEVTTATTLEGGVAAAFERPPNLIIIDEQMTKPGEEGVVALLHKDARTADIPLILLRARDVSAAEDRVEGGAEGGAGGGGGVTQLHKPFRPSHLVALARTQL